ncbi:NAD-dependent epimerase/dehydratase family protein [Sphingobacterium sp.]|uniref:NAD-dependent epimerase/dehydratase family protein n=1 Tax=Sphingobacterium sp. TaxID=341027 RepID=UPI002588501F|nr:NAD-dependent epimerase/dehydratase family protein [Sphingobacterium sp.]WET70807.1 MAG: NAD-dependent epimerase/dehydratase family protein [Sphingobacterium sp.]
MKIQITGISGFVGSNLKEYLTNRNIDVTALSMRSSNWISLIEDDADALVHLAGKAHDTISSGSSEEYFAINRDLTIELFKCFLKSNISDFFYFSSSKAVADTVNGVLTEEIVGNPQTAYGKSKWEGEQYLLGQELPLGKRLFIIRPCMIHGPGNKGNLNLLYKVVLKGVPWPLANFVNKRSFLSIDNLCFLIEQMIYSKDVPSGIYNFADDDSLSTNSLVELIAKCVGKPKRLWHIPTTLIKMIVKVGDILPLPLNSERLKKLTESYVVSNNKIKKVLRIQKLPTTSIDGLRKTIMSFTERQESDLNT